MLNWLRKKLDTRSTQVHRDGDMIRFGNSGESTHVSEETALRLIDVRACIDVISADIASLSIHAFQRISDDERTKLVDHPVARLLKRPNVEMTRPDWFGSALCRMLLYGQSFDFLDWKNGRVQSVHPLGNSKVKIVRPNGELRYRVTIGKETQDLEPWQICHFRNFTLDGVNALSPIQHAAITLSSTIQMGVMQEKFFKEGLHLGGVLSHPERLSPEAKDQLRYQLQGVVIFDCANG